jgi:hypothetical protein
VAVGGARDPTGRPCMCLLVKFFAATGFAHRSHLRAETVC